MVATELNAPRPLMVAGAAVLGTTFAAALGAAVDPGLAALTAPHPTLAGSLDDWLTIAAENARVLAAPYLLWALGTHRSRPGRRFGDLAIVVVVAVNTIPVGIALGRWRGQLLSYVPQLPLEWAALTTAVSAWLTIRTSQTTRRQIARLAAATTMLVIVAAGLETWATPHRPTPRTVGRASVDTVPTRPCPGGGPGVDCATDCAPDRPGRCKVARSLPLTTFGFARPSPGADRASSTTPGPPQGGTTE